MFKRSHSEHKAATSSHNIQHILVTLAVLTAMQSAQAMYWDSFPQPESCSGTSAVARVREAGSLNHSGVIAFVSDNSEVGKAFERAYFGHGGQKIYKATNGMFVQIVAPKDIPGGAKVGSIVALTPDGTATIATLVGRPTIKEIRTFSEWVKGMVNRASAQQKSA